MNNQCNYFKISNNVSYTYLIIFAKFQSNSIIIFEVIIKSFMPRAYKDYKIIQNITLEIFDFVWLN